MPKNQFIDPNIIRKHDNITFGTIPVNQYNNKLSDERKNFSDDDLIRIYRDMVIIREFETMLNEIKIKNEYQGITYNHPGPAHLSIGQEAAAVGMAYHLTVDDLIFGSHRSHGEILAKGLSAILQLSDSELRRHASVSSRNHCPCLYGPDRKSRTRIFDYPMGYDQTCWCCKCLVELRRRRNDRS